jgi:hypothetical protein
MFNALTAAQSPPRSLPEPVNQSQQLAFIAKAVPEWLTNTRAENIAALKQAVGPLMPAYDMASAPLRREMKSAFEVSWISSNNSVNTLKKLQGIEQFAEPLLTAALKDKFSITLDVKATCLRLYCPKGIAVGFDVRTLSLLEAALHNFEGKETRAGYFDDASDFVTQPSSTGQFDIVPIKSRLSVEGFATLCRELDIGARYQAYLKAFMGFGNPVARAVLTIKVQTSHKDALRAASVMALMQHDIDLDAQHLLLKWAEGHRALMFQGNPMLCFGLTMLDTALSDIVLIAADLERSEATEQIIAYVPHDPQHPVKRYASVASFAAELTAQLRDPEYQRFFSRFVPHHQRGNFFSRLDNALSRVQWHAPVPFEQTPTWRAEPIEKPNLRMTYQRISGDFWAHDFQQKLNRILDDARAMAVPTDDEDEKSRWARWDSFQKVAVSVLEVGAFVVAPFVPFLGELMLAYTAYQLLDETFEGIVEWSEGQRVEAAGHLLGMAESLIQLGTFVAGGKLVGDLLPFKLSPFVERMKVVEMNNGQARLWQPDLGVYEQKITLHNHARPDANGIYRHEGQEVLALDNKHFAIRPEPGRDQYRIEHPTRADAYSPRLAHNGVGAWSHEAERPEAWRGVTLMRRLGHSVESFSDQTLERIRVVSGVKDTVLRKLHVEHERPPALLMETIKRFKAHQEMQTFIEQMSSDDPQVFGKADVKTQLELLTAYGTWPALRAVELLGRDGKVLWDYLPESATDQRLQIREAQSGHDDLAKTLLRGLTEPHIKTLLSEESGIGLIALDVRVARLRRLIAGLAESQKARLVEARYKLLEHAEDTSDSPHVQLLRNDFAHLPRSVIDELLTHATPTELLQMRDGRQLPLRMRQAARAATLELRLLRSYEGLYLASSEHLDTARLALHGLEQLDGWAQDLRVEIRDQAFGGPLLDSVGPAESAVRKVLVSSDGSAFQPYDDEGNSLHGIDDFYTAILQALPDASRKALGYEIGQGGRLKQALQETPLTHDEFRDVLLQHPILKPAYDPVVMRLRGGMQGYESIEARQGGVLSPGERFRTLYPGTTADGFTAFMQSFTSEAQAISAIRAREVEFDGLSKALANWVAIERGELLPMDQRFHKGRFAKAIKQCWQAAGELAPEGHTLDLNFHWPSDFLEYLPVLEANFGHVSGLQFRHVELQADITGFLRYFPNLRTLDLSDNALLVAPALQANLPALEHLNLSNNQLTLTAQSEADLGGLTRLQVLKLGNNPALGRAPDISRMHELNQLDLHNTGIADWPNGLFDVSRPRSFELDLQDNPIEQIPQVTPGSEQARLVARTRLNRDQLTEQSLQQFQGYMRSVGYDPTRSYPPKGEETSEYWLEGVSGEQRELKQTTWDELEREPNAQGFFEVLEQLCESADYVDDTYRPGLTKRVWRMLDALSQNTPLREELFRMATNPDSCADAGAQIFNEMGIKVLVHEAYLAGGEEQIEASLITLAKGKSRLDQVNEIARATIQSRLQAGETFQAVDEDGEITGTIDEVEVYLAFQTGLADRLELPWQSRDMLFRAMAEVDDAQIDQAYQSIVALEAGDGLVNQIVEQRFWRKYLKSRYPREFAQNSVVYNSRSEDLLNRHLAGAVLQHEYERQLIELAERRKGLLGVLTQEAMQKTE